MKFLAVTIALAGLAAAIPQAVPPQANGPCDEGGPKDKVCVSSFYSHVIRLLTIY